MNANAAKKHKRFNEMHCKICRIVKHFLIINEIEQRNAVMIHMTAEIPTN
jgi:hypothetical protein